MGGVPGKSPCAKNDSSNTLCVKSILDKAELSFVLKFISDVKFVSNTSAIRLSPKSKSVTFVKALIPVISVIVVTLLKSSVVTACASTSRIFPLIPLVSIPSSTKNCSKLGSGIRVVCAKAIPLMRNRSSNNSGFLGMVDLFNRNKILI